MGYGMENKLIVGEDTFYSLDTNETHLNNNCIVFGSPGSGKTTGFVLPNIMQANGSYIVTDCKGNLYKKASEYLKKMGYRVQLLDFKSLKNSTCRYNPFHYIGENDIEGIRRMASILIGKPAERDPFWDQAATLLITSIIAYLVQCCPKRMHTFENLISLLTIAKIVEEDKKTKLDLLYEKLASKCPDAFCIREYEKIRTSPQRTFNSIVVSATAKTGALENPLLNQLTGGDDNIDLRHLGDSKRAVFVNISDTDRSSDQIANLFFSQVFHVLCDYADTECEGERLPYPVTVFMDDFGTNISIKEFPKLISSMRSRNISASIILQAISQLEGAYGKDSNTVLAACDTTLYYGGNDYETCKTIAQRTGTPLEDVMNQRIGDVRVIRRGQKPVISRRFDMEKYLDYFRKKEKRGKLFSEVLR